MNCPPPPCPHPSYLPAERCRPGLSEDILKLVQLLRGILPPYGWPRPCSLPRGAWIRVTRLSTRLAALPLFLVLMTAQMFQQILQNVSGSGATNINPGCWHRAKEWICGRKLQHKKHFLFCCWLFKHTFTTGSDGPAPRFACLLSPNGTTGDRKKIKRGKSQQISHQPKP